MIIDCHGHVSAPAQLWAYKAVLLASRGSHGRGGVKVTDDEMRAALNAAEIGPKGHLGALARSRHRRAADLAAAVPAHASARSRRSSCTGSPRSATTSSTGRRRCIPGKFFGVASLPQVAGDPIERALPELERCVNELGFVGCLLNPDPYENSGVEPPALGDRYWYPLYEKLCELDIPAHIHTASSRSERASYSVHLINEGTIAILGLLNSDVFKDFPNLKIVVSHGGGAIPYQLGRFDAPSLRGRGATRFRDRLKLLYFDTVLYTAPALELLIKTVGPDRCLFGSECPGRRLGGRSRHRPHHGPHPAAHRRLRLAVAGRPREDFRRQRAQGIQAQGVRPADSEEATMAKIVLAMATTHGPQLHTTVEQWQLRVKADKGRKHPFRNGVYSFDELVEMRRAEGLDAKSSMEAQTRLSRALPRRDGDAGRQVGSGRRRRRGHPRQRPGRDLQDRAAQSGLHGVLRRHHPELSAVGGGQEEAAARRRRGRARPCRRGLQGISRRARSRRCTSSRR